jgi:hypothetical protein
VAEDLFLFVQLEFPWELGPPDGRYLIRASAGGDPERVVVLETLGARVRASWRGQRMRRATRSSRGPAVDPEPEPTPVPTSRATLIDPAPVAADRQAKAWLRELDVERAVRDELALLNRILHMHRISAGDPYVHEVSADQALTIRAGWGEGEDVADGRWRHARELRVASTAQRSRRRRRGARVAALRSQERFAELLGARANVLVCEEFALRARLDLDHGRTEHAAAELANAYRAALSELREEAMPELEIRVAELEQLAPALAPDLARAHAAARAAPLAAHEPAPAEPEPVDADGAGSADASGKPDDSTIRHALERLEAALRARAAALGRA